VLPTQARAVDQVVEAASDASFPDTSSPAVLMFRAALCLVMLAVLVARATAQDATPSLLPDAGALHSPASSVRPLEPSPRDAPFPDGMVRASWAGLKSVDARLTDAIGFTARPRTGTGILIGGVVGVLVGYFVGSGLVDSSDCSDCMARRLGAIAGGVIGGVVGGLIGSRSSRGGVEKASAEDE
jgi:hypothetical protein